LKYEIDESTMLLMEEVLNMAQRTVEIQYDLNIAKSMQCILEEIAQRFDLECREEPESADIMPLVRKGKPTLTLVDGGLDTVD